jgi:hypothetical protein
VFDKPPDQTADPNAPLPSPPKTSLGKNSPRVIPLDTDSAESKEFQFSAEEGKRNEWTITLPDQLIQAVRQKLKAPDASTKR